MTINQKEYNENYERLKRESLKSNVAKQREKVKAQRVKKRLIRKTGAKLNGLASELNKKAVFENVNL